MSERDRHAENTADPPRTVAGFRLLRKIGEGGMSAVYQSYDVSAGRPVAVKLLADHLAGQPEFVGRFYREARLSRVLEHPHIVQGYASGFDADVGQHYLVLEFIDGPTAHGALARLGPLSIGSVVRIGIDIALALEFLHDRQYVHRDVKPDNILLHPGGIAKLADLGLAKRINDDAQLTAVHQGVGTSYYMPYEQAINANLVDGRSDIFALGATLYHLLTGEVPFSGATHDEIVREKWEGTFRPVCDANPAVPKELADLVEATLACDPRARIQKAGQLARALAATRLATPLPTFAHETAGPTAEGPAPSPGALTRADHGIPIPGTRPPVPPPVAPTGDSFAAGFSLPVGAEQTLPPIPPLTGFPRRNRGWFWFVGAGVLVLALLAARFARSRPEANVDNPGGTPVVREASQTPHSLPTGTPQ